MKDDLLNKLYDSLSTNTDITHRGSLYQSIEQIISVYDERYRQLEDMRCSVAESIELQTISINSAKCKIEDIIFDVYNLDSDIVSELDIDFDIESYSMMSNMVPEQTKIMFNKHKKRLKTDCHCRYKSKLIYNTIIREQNEIVQKEFERALDIMKFLITKDPNFDKHSEYIYKNVFPHVEYLIDRYNLGRSYNKSQLLIKIIRTFIKYSKIPVSPRDVVRILTEKYGDFIDNN